MRLSRRMRSLAQVHRLGTVYVAADKADTYVEAMRDTTKKLFDTFEATYLTCK